VQGIGKSGTDADLTQRSIKDIADKSEVNRKARVNKEGKELFDFLIKGMTKPMFG